MLISDDGTRFALSKAEIAVLTSMMADPDTRPTLAALWLHPAKAQAWATDGHRAVLAERWMVPPKAKAGARPVAIPAVAAANVAKTAATRDLVVVDLSGPEVRLDVRATPTTGTKVETFDQIESLTVSKHAVTCRHQEDATLGSIDHLFPSIARGRKGATVAVDPALLKSVMTLAKVADPSRVWINVGRPTEPVLFTVAAGTTMTWRMLVMPLRADLGQHPDASKVTTSTDAPAEATKPARTTRAKRGGKRTAEAPTTEATKGRGLRAVS
ncbi:MAG: hypothetical protein KC501_21740 [Myxococcales bacterium]|nr:hypothetical protein [Myxococcales bacterium]